jgi:hypothetical protein
MNGVDHLADVRQLERLDARSQGEDLIVEDGGYRNAVDVVLLTWEPVR